MLIGDGGDEDGLVVLHADKVGSTGTLRLSLEADELAGSLGLGLLGGILLDTGDEPGTALARLDMLNANADALLNVAVANRLVDDDAEGTLRDVEDDTGLAVVELVGHALLDGTVGLDVDEVPDLVGGHVGGELDHAMIAEAAGEEMASAGTVTEGMGHPLKMKTVTLARPGLKSNFSGRPGPPYSRLRMTLRTSTPPSSPFSPLSLNHPL